MVSEGYGLSNEKPNWQDEIKEILARSELDWEQLFPQMVRLMTKLLILTMGPMVIHSPESRERIRQALAEEGLPPEDIEQLIYEVIEKSTRPLERKNK